MPAVRTIPLPLAGLDDRDGLAIEEVASPDLRNVRTLRNRVDLGPGTTLMAPTPIPGSTPGKAMSVGTFVRNVAAGSQTVPHDLGIAPKAIILLTSGATALDTPAAGMRLAQGFTDLTTSRSIAASSAHDASPSQSARRYANKLLTILKSDATVAAECDYTSSNATSFTINWTTADTTAEYITFIVIGHSAVSAKVLEWTLTTGTGALAVTGVGFAPQLCLHLTTGATVAGTSTGMAAALGTMDAGGQWGLCVMAAHAAAGANQANESHTASDCITLGTSAGAESARVRRTSLDADGFTLNKVVAPSSGVLVATLCLTGFASVDVGTFSRATETAPVTQAITGLGFAPLGGMMHTLGFTTADKYPDGLLGGDISLMLGAFGGSGAQAAVDVWQDGQAYPTQTGKIASSNYIWADHGGGGGDFQLIVRSQAQIQSLDADGFSLNWTKTGDDPKLGYYWTIRTTTSAFASVGTPRTYGQVVVGSTPVERIVLLTDLSAFVYNSATGLFDPTAEAYTGAAARRFSIANTLAIAAWSQGTDNIRQYNGAFSALVTSGTNHAARTLLAFNNRIVSVRPLVAGIDQKTQIRWCVNGSANDWAGTGSGTLEIVETSQQPLTGGFVLGERGYVTRMRELIELIATGTLSPVFRPITRVSGIGVLATYSVATGDVYAFWLAPDDVCQWDGGTLRKVGERTYHTINQYIDFSNLDNIQGWVNTVDSEYWLLVPPYVFIYDYRREHWYFDQYTDIAAGGTITVGDQFTTSIGASQFVAFGHADARTFRVDYSSDEFLGGAIDAWITTRDFVPTTEQGQPSPLLPRYGTLWRLWFRGTPGEVVEVQLSTDKGLTWKAQTVTVNPAGVGIAFYNDAFATLRVRFRSQAGSAFSLQGPVQYEFSDAGVMLPA